MTFLRAAYSSGLWHGRIHLHLASELKDPLKRTRRFIRSFPKEPTLRRSASSWHMAMSVSLVAAVIAVLARSSTDLEEEGQETPLLSYRIDIGFMAKLAQKPYLSFSQQKQPSSTRPPGVPASLRILAVDLPELDDAFTGGTCHILANRTYPNGVARPVSVPIQQEKRHDDEEHPKSPKTEKHKHSKQLQVEQKVWVQHLLECRQNDLDSVGVEVMHANTANLNPRSLRKLRRLGTIHYNPGVKSYASRNKKKQKEQESVSKNNVEDQDEAAFALVSTTPLDELDAPWNQHAWLEEMELRIAGKVAFGEPLEPAGRWSRYVWGNYYQTTIPSSSRWWSWGGDAAGLDGSGDCWASNKPHAVIANGAALQKVPNALRRLQKACRDNDVELFVVRDPRAWGSNTHDTLGDALRDLRRTVKQNITQTSLQHAVGTAFSRGRWVGQMETETKWQAKESVRATKEALRRANVSRKQREEMDWKNLDEIGLEEKLVRRGVIHRSKQFKGNKETTVRTYSNGLVALARRCVADQQPLDTTKPNDNKDAEKEPVPSPA